MLQQITVLLFIAESLRTREVNTLKGLSKDNIISQDSPFRATNRISKAF
jgi:hypothetical protein